jgi:hypothetical protein
MAQKREVETLGFLDQDDLSGSSLSPFIRFSSATHIPARF